MENKNRKKANKNEKVNINDELLADVSGGISPGLVGSGKCSVCGNHVPKVNLELHHSRLVCKVCLVKLNNG